MGAFCRTCVTQLADFPAPECKARQFFEKLLLLAFHRMKKYH
jgi:hypothetical protein